MAICGALWTVVLCLVCLLWNCALFALVLRIVARRCAVPGRFHARHQPGRSAASGRRRSAELVRRQTRFDCGLFFRHFCGFGRNGFWRTAPAGRLAARSRPRKCCVCRHSSPHARSNFVVNLFSLSDHSIPSQVYQTSARATGFGFCNSASRVAGVATPWIAIALGGSNWIPLLVYAAASGAAGCVALFCFVNKKGSAPLE